MTTTIERVLFRTVPAVVFLAAFAGAAASDTEYRRVALSGDPAPGSAPGVVFRTFAEGYNEPEPGPRIDEQGRVAFFALLDGPGVDASNDSGVWVEGAGGLELVARAGAPAPGAAGVFHVFPESFAPAAPLTANGRVAFMARLNGTGVEAANDRGVWSSAGAVLSLVVREDEPAPGAGPDVEHGEPGLSYLNAAGDLLVSDALRGSGITTDDNECFWSDRGGAMALVLREGDPAPGAGPGVVFGGGVFVGSPYPFGELRFNDLSELAVQANLVGPGVTTFSNEALFAERSGSLSMIVREGDPAPGAGPGVTFGGNSVLFNLQDLTLNDSGHVAFTCRLGGSVPTSTALYSDHTGTLTPLVLPDDPAPGTNDTFAGYGDPVLSDGGRVAFRASLAGAGAYPPAGVWWDQPGPPGALAPLVIPGDPVPGRAGATFDSVHWIQGFTAAGVIALHGTMTDPVSGSSRAVVLSDAAGNMAVVAKAGEAFDVAGDGSDPRTIDRITVGGLTEAGVLAFRLDFTDDTSGIFTAALSGGSPGGTAGLAVGKGPTGLELSWDPDCGGSTTYAVYRGDLGGGYASIAPEPGFCAVAATSTTVPPGPGQADFLLVVPTAGGSEGSYGVDSAGDRRPPAAAACLPTGAVDACAPGAP